jgi:hypothetical protein
MLELQVCTTMPSLEFFIKINYCAQSNCNCGELLLLKIREEVAEWLKQ